MLQHSQLDEVFHALSDSTRRAVVERLIEGPASVSELASPFAMSLAAIGQHIQLLEACGLVKTAKVGRVRTVSMVPETLRSVESWFASHRERWQQRFDRLGALLLEEEDAPEPTIVSKSKQKKAKNHE
jgi:DNA-binding transcriptional ArsR family regulator